MQQSSRTPIIILVLLLWAFPAVAAQQSESDSSAWVALVNKDADLVGRASLLERDILELLTVTMARAYMAGVSADEIILMTGESLETFLPHRGIAEFDISWYSIDGGGTSSSSSSGAFQLDGTVGQPDTGITSGENFALMGGFWAATRIGDIFEDGFESGGTSSWSNTVGRQPESSGGNP